jgi:subfamily B ATP-binding cassette protein MsbA
VIAHRLSTIRRADQILVIEQGRIVERGTHEQLYVARGRYRELYDKQHGLESNLFLAPGEGDITESRADANESEKSEGEGVTDALRLVGGE